MGLRWSEVVLECRDPLAVAEFWSAALGWPVRRFDEDGEVYYDLEPPAGLPEIAFVPSPDAKTHQLRLHIDLRPTGGATQDEEVARLLALGATRADVGQGEDVSWVVLADVEGNEFCVLVPDASPAPEPSTG